jgi:uncharacterized membrane protein
MKNIIINYLKSKIKKIIISAIILVIIDYIYLSHVGEKYNKMIYKIQNDNMTIKYKSAIICYLLLVFGLNYFIIKDNRSPNDAFLLGFIIYGVYDSTNYATIDKWDLNMAIIDSFWGGTLFYLTTYTTYYISNKYL